MSGRIQQPQTQVPLTNVAIVRLNSNSYIQDQNINANILIDDEFEDESQNSKNKGRGKKRRKRDRRRNKKQYKSEQNNNSSNNNKRNSKKQKNKRNDMGSDDYYFDDYTMTNNSSSKPASNGHSNHGSNKKNKKFEIACYKNKVLNWRSGVEKDIGEVLQIDRVFENVKAGRYANTDDLQRVFKTTNEAQICKIILNKGELQVSKNERIERYNNKFKEIATIISEKCVNTETRKPIPVKIIENAMREARCAESIIRLEKSSKLQAINMIKILQTHPKTLMPIQRAQMKLKINIPSNPGKRIKSEFEHLLETVDSEVFGNVYQLIVFIDPGNYRTIYDIIAKLTRGKGNIEVLDTCVQSMGNEILL